MFLEKKEKEREFKVDYEFSDGSILKEEKSYYKARDFTYLNIDNHTGFFTINRYYHIYFFDLPF